VKSKNKPIKVLIAKTGLDGHNRGAKMLTLGLRDEGMEVIYTGIRQTPEDIAEIALQEDVDVVGLSSLCGSHQYTFPKVVELLKAKGMNDVLVLGGGVIQDADKPFLKEKGIKEVFGPGSRIKDISKFIKENVKTH